MLFLSKISVGFSMNNIICYFIVLNCAEFNPMEKYWKWKIILGISKTVRCKLEVIIISVYLY